MVKDFCYAAVQMTCRFIVDWVTTRDLWNAIVSIPAIAFGIVMMLLVFPSRSSQSLQIEKYQLDAIAALQEPDYQQAKFLYRKIAQLATDKRGPRLALGLLAANDNDMKRAEHIISSLAPEKGTGYPLAHLWMAKHILNTTREIGPEQTARLEHHLVQAMERDGQNIEALILLARVKVMQDDLLAATDLLTRASEKHPELLLDLASLLARQGDSEEAKLQLQRAAAYFRVELDHDKRNSAHRVHLAQALLLQNDFAEAEKLLLDGTKYKSDKTDDTMSSQVLANLYVAWSDKLGAEPTSDLGKRLELLERALLLEPDHLGALQSLSRLANTSATARPEIEKTVEGSLTRGKAPALSHLVLGNLAALDKDYAKALLHLESAQQLQPNNPLIANDLAWVLSEIEAPQLDRALALMEPAIQRVGEWSPLLPDMRETRSKILILMGRDREAIVDLEFALSRLPKRADIHLKLAACYERLGEHKLAEEHRRLAEEKGTPTDKPMGT